jgi:16S rRNA A1518/A1519 N6-dimethyltransferase RsmA/KsgA/DIM1 with predicted DNA glycosylase/AP lyase activity
MIRLKRKNFDLDINNFSKFIREAFKHRRKKIKNNLNKYLLDNDIAEKRPEDINVLQYIEIYNKNFF